MNTPQIDILQTGLAAQNLTGDGQQKAVGGGIRMTDVEIMIKALRLTWIPRLLTPEIRNWKTIPGYYLRKTGGLNFLLR